MAGAGTPGREGTPMLTVVPDVAGALPADGQASSLIDQIVRDGARQMLAAALQAEVAAYKADTGRDTLELDLAQAPLLNVWGGKITAFR